MSLRADRYRQRAAEAKDRAAQAQNPFIKSAFENVAATWIALAEQVERLVRTRRWGLASPLLSRRPTGFLWRPMMRCCRALAFSALTTATLRFHAADNS
jgi:hypothetical protein